MNEGNKLLVFCEEPEMYLHPGLQRVLLNAFQRFPENQYFLTTHSNHFLDLTLDYAETSVFTFRKELEGDGEERNAKIIIENISNEDTRSLQLLGVQNSSVFLSNCTIWVEGITDRMYFRKYLELYQKEPGVKTYKEDLHYSFVEYSGGNVTHWSFLDEEGPVVERLCGRLFLIADGDNASGAKADRYKTLAEKLKDRFYVTKCKEVENLLTPEVLKEVLKGYGEKKFKDFTQAQYSTKPLGTFIEQKIIDGVQERRGAYADGPTITDKDGFCTRAVSAMNKFSDVSDEAEEITKRLHAFIAVHNP
jgi:predicted ATP-dependent endonuclease of OLD family